MGVWGQRVLSTGKVFLSGLLVANCAAVFHWQTGSETWYAAIRAAPGYYSNTVGSFFSENRCLLSPEPRSSMSPLPQNERSTLSTGSITPYLP